jgi:hypothetical protein
MHLDEIVPKLQLAVGPVILISGVGMLVLTMTNRLGRVIDRARQLAVVVRTPGLDNHDQDGVLYQLGVIARRARLLRASIALALMSTLMAAVLVIALFVFAVMGLDSAWVVVILFVACLFLLIASLIVFLRDINLSLYAIDREIRDAEAVCCGKSQR